MVGQATGCLSHNHPSLPTEPRYWGGEQWGPAESLQAQVILARCILLCHVFTLLVSLVAMGPSTCQEDLRWILEVFLGSKRNEHEETLCFGCYRLQSTSPGLLWECDIGALAAISWSRGRDRPKDGWVEKQRDLQLFIFQPLKEH